MNYDQKSTEVEQKTMENDRLTEEIQKHLVSIVRLSSRLRFREILPTKINLLRDCAKVSDIT